jgi:hypothetical protein
MAVLYVKFDNFIAEYGNVEQILGFHDAWD